MHLSYSERAGYCSNPTASRLFRLMDDKKTNLALSADVTTAAELIALADQLGPEICVLKTHIDIIADFTPALTQTLRALATKHRFLLFEDRKFADIGHTVKQQYAGGIYRIASWADVINAHTLPGPGIIAGLKAAGMAAGGSLLLLAEMSSAGNLLDKHYRQQTLAMAESHQDFVIGFITQHALSTQPHWLYFTPGVQLANGTDSLGQQYQTPETAILAHGSDVIIVGRGIIAETNPLRTAKTYRQAAFDAYLQRTSMTTTQCETII